MVHPRGVAVAGHGTEHTEGLVEAEEELVITAESDLVIFGDGIEADALHLTWGQQARLRVASQRLHLLAAPTPS